MQTVRMQSREQRARAPAALYIRADGGDPDNTLELQLERLQRHAGANRLDPVRVYFETRGSRIQFDWMTAEATGERPPFRRILAVNYSRFAVPREEFRHWAERLERHGVSVGSITEAAWRTPES